MTVLTALARALAAKTGRAQPTKTRRHVHLSSRPLVLVPLQLAGEACAPLAAMVGDARDKPLQLAVYEPRDRTRRFEFAADLAETVLAYIEGYVTTEPDDGQPYPDAPQLLVPNAGGVAFARLLGRSTRFRRTEGEYAVPAAVPLLGQWLSYYSERTEATGSALLVPLTTVLADHWATGQSAIEDANLAALLAWIDPPDGMTGPEAARVAEDPVRCPPAGPVTDPTFDNEVLEHLVKAVRDAAADGGAAQARLTAEAFAGTVTAADPARLDTEGRRAKLRPRITVATADEVVLDPGTVLRSPDRPGQDATIVDIAPAEHKTLVILELKGGMGQAKVAPPGTMPQIGDEVTYTTLRDEFQRAPEFPARENTPWTHGGPPVEYVPTDDDAREDWS